MAYKILIWNEKRWLKDLSKLSKQEAILILDKLAELEQEPWSESVQVKKLKNYDLADFRLRVGDYRILFDRDLARKELRVYRVLHRSKLY